ncbi:MAG: hypothetical protein U0X40_06210 [Ferruginibacter sp.]
MTDLLKQFENEKGCPKCGSLYVEPVKYTWWGGLLGPKLLHHTKCNECGFRFNSKTRKSNTQGIIIYSVIAFGLALAIVFALRFWMH